MWALPIMCSRRCFGTSVTTSRTLSLAPLCGDALDEVPLRGEEDDDHRDGGHHHPRDDDLPVALAPGGGAVLPEQHEQPAWDRVEAVVAQVDQGLDQVPPARDEFEDGGDDQGGL